MLSHTPPVFHNVYRGWIRGREDGSDLVDDRSDSFETLKHHFGRSGTGDFSHGRVSLRPWMPPIFDQGRLHSCTANALAGAVGFEHDALTLSRIQLYYLSRAYEHRTQLDSGARLHNAIRALREFGAAPERYCPYDEAKVSDRPRAVAMQQAQHHKISRYAPLSGGAMYRECLDLGYPFVIGMYIAASFWSEAAARSGMITLPPEDEPRVHAHAMCVIGYARRRPEPTGAGRGRVMEYEKLYYEVRNSVGAEWGDEGHAWVPADYLEDRTLAGDAWTVRR